MGFWSYQRFDNVVSNRNKKVMRDGKSRGVSYGNFAALLIKKHEAADRAKCQDNVEQPNGQQQSALHSADA